MNFKHIIPFEFGRSCDLSMIDQPRSSLLTARAPHADTGAKIVAISPASFYRFTIHRETSNFQSLPCTLQFLDSLLYSPGRTTCRITEISFVNSPLYRRYDCTTRTKALQKSYCYQPRIPSTAQLNLSDRRTANKDNKGSNIVS